MQNVASFERTGRLQVEFGKKTLTVCSQTNSSMQAVVDSRVAHLAWKMCNADDSLSQHFNEVFKPKQRPIQLLHVVSLLKCFQEYFLLNCFPNKSLNSPRIPSQSEKVILKSKSQGVV